MAQNLVKIAADISTTLTTKASIGATSATLTSGLDSDGVQLPTGTYGFTIDRSNSQKEYFTATLTGSALTNIKNVTRGTGVGTAGLVREHRKGAEVIISDWVALKRVIDVLDGTTSLDSATPLGYDGTATISTDNQLATKAYVDGVAISGAADSSTTVKGITKMSVAPVSASSPIAVGDNDGRVSTQGENDAQVGNNIDIAVGTGNKFITQTGLQHNAEKYAADAGSNDTYVITLSPVPTSYTNGMVVYFKANTTNTGAATLNVNSLGAITIVKGVSTTLANNDILAGQFCTVIYDGTNFVLQNPVSTNTVSNPVYKNGISTLSGVKNGGTLVIAHGLGTTPKKLRISAKSIVSSIKAQSEGSYNGTDNNCVYQSDSGPSNGTMATKIIYLIESSGSAFITYGAATWDSTNFTITWASDGSGGNANGSIMWEAEA